MIGFADAFMGARRQRMAEDEAIAARAERDERMGWERSDRARLAGMQREEDTAFRGLQTLQRDGVVQPGATGLSQPSAQMAYGGEYGMDTAYGTGAEGVQNLAGDYQREMSRFAQAAPAPVGEDGAPRGLPRYDGTAGVGTRAARKSEVYGGMLGVAAAKRDMGAYAQAYGLKEGALDDETMADVKMPKVGTPEFTAMADQLVTQLNTNHKSVTLGDADKRGFRQLAVVGANGRAVFEKLSSAEQLKLAQANALMERNPTKAMQMIESVNKALADAIAKDNDFVMKTGEAGNNAAFRAGSLANDEARTTDQRDYQRGMLANAQGARKDAAARAPKEVSAATLEKMRAIEVAFIQAEGDPKRQAALRREYAIVSANAGAEIGRPRGIPTERDTSALTPGQALEMRAKLKTAGYDDARIESLVTGYDPIAEIAKLLEAKKAAAAPALAPQRAPAETGTTGQRKFGLLTPQSLVEREAAAGNPDALRYIEAMRQNLADAEAERLNPSYPY